MKSHHLDPYAELEAALARKEIQGKSVLVTGGGYGIGSAIAKSFAEAGAAEVILAGRTESRLAAAVDALSSIKSTKFSYQVVDISSDQDVKRLYGALKESPDILVNNAGYMAAPAGFIDADLEDYWKTFTVNIYGTALVTQSYLRHRRERKTTSPAVIITLNTIGAYSVRVPGLSAYGGSKGGLARMMELAAVDVPETTARFITVHPGAVKTDMGLKSGLDGVFPSTDAKLAGDFIAWSATEEASFLSGRFAWVNWDIEELKQAKGKIIESDLLRTSLSG
jgi:NAD(P)-dependent dehydrogenase (short-subunit alcohol dehydrogenase family)